MKLAALFAALALMGACANPPDPDHRPTAAEMQEARLPPLQQHGVYFKVVDDNGTTLQRMFKGVPVEAADGVARAVERWWLDERQPTAVGASRS